MHLKIYTVHRSVIISVGCIKSVKVKAGILYWNQNTRLISDVKLLVKHTSFRVLTYYFIVTTLTLTLL